MDFGSQLREARERRGVSLRQIATATRISIRALEALERNDIAKLPGGIFSRAFVRAYAEEVGLDPDDAVREFLTQFSHEDVTAGSPLTEPLERREDERPGRRKQMVGLVMTAAIVVPLAGLATYFWLSSRDGVAASENAAGQTQGEISTPTAGTPSAGTPSAAPKPASTSASAPNDGARVTTAPAAAALAAGAPLDPRVHGLRVALAPEAPCWVRVTGDGVKLFEGLLQKGERRELTAKDTLIVVAGDAGALRFTLNGRPGRPLGASGEVITARITTDNLRTWLQP